LRKGKGLSSDPGVPEILRAARGDAMTKKERLKKLAKKTDDAECPITWEDWKKFLATNERDTVSFFGTFWIVAKEYLIESFKEEPETLEELLKDEDGKNMLALCLSIGFDEWAPDLFRKLNAERVKEARHQKKFVSMDNLENIPAPDEDKIELIALIKKWKSSKRFQKLGKWAEPIIEAKLRTSDATQKEIGKKLGISRETVNRYQKKFKLSKPNFKNL
jgi:transcriptional regulator with XRE-family HTH domain